MAGSKPNPVLWAGGMPRFCPPGSPCCPRLVGVLLAAEEPAARAELAAADDGMNLLRYSLALDTSPMTNGLRPAGPNLAAKCRTTGAFKIRIKHNHIKKGHR